MSLNPKFLPIKRTHYSRSHVFLVRLWPEYNKAVQKDKGNEERWLQSFADEVCREMGYHPSGYGPCTAWFMGREPGDGLGSTSWKKKLNEAVGAQQDDIVITCGDSAD